MEETYKTEITKNKTDYAIMKYTFPHLLAPKTHIVSKWAPNEQLKHSEHKIHFKNWLRYNCRNLTYAISNVNLIKYQTYYKTLQYEGHFKNVQSAKFMVHVRLK